MSHDEPNINNDLNDDAKDDSPARLGRREALGAGIALAIGLAAPGALAAKKAGKAATAQGGKTAATPVIATTQAGKVRGAMRDGVASFKGVRYGATTEGRRFLPPQAPQPWEGVQDALDYHNQAPQPVGSGGIGMGGPPLAIYKGLMNDRPNSEDCLFLNVWTQGLRDGKKRPVMVSLHGGAFMLLSAAGAVYDGTRLCQRGDAVVVGINHRLNVFGYLYLGDEGELADAGNTGSLDMIQALAWVRDNIAEFGGDPGNVTIFGESGGGAKVTTLMAMPAAKGLFHKAIVQSGPYLMGQTKESAPAYTKKYMAALGLEPGQISQLRTLPMDKMVAGFKTLLATTSKTALGFGPVVDGRSLPRQPFDPDAPEVSKEVPMMIGTTRYEAASLLPLFDPEAFTVSDEGLRMRLGAMLQGRDVAATIAELKRLYPFSTPSDLYFTAGSWAMFRQQSAMQAERKAAQGGAPAYAYLLSWETPADGGKWKAPHGLDIPMVFDNIAGMPAMVGAAAGQAQRIAEAMSTAWINFAKTGSPGWAPYDAAQRLTMVFDASSKVVADPDGDERQLFAGPVMNPLPS